jgi:hypothetical protein
MDVNTPLENVDFWIGHIFWSPKIYGFFGFGKHIKLPRGKLMPVVLNASNRKAHVCWKFS